MDAHIPGGETKAIAHYLRPALEDLRRLDLEFETYLLEMVILALQGEGAKQVRAATPMPVVGA